MQNSTARICSTKFLLVRIIARDSGVVTKICGGFLDIFALSAVVVSPVLKDILIPNFFSTISSISFKGCFKLTSISLANALRGDVYTAYTLFSNFPFSDRSIK